MKLNFKKISKKKKIILLLITLLLIVYIFCLPRQLFDVPYATVVTDRSGELLGARIAADGQWRFPPCDTVPEKFSVCLQEYEDHYFSYHWGVNPLAIGRAIRQNVKAKRIVSGGSTITMQTIRLSRGEKRTFGEKLIEAVLATRLEFRHSKEKILALYASHAPFGGNVVGLDAASWRYFGHASSELSWAEAATLAVLPNAPSMIHLAKNRPALEKKRNALLYRLYQQKIIEKTDYELAITEPLPTEPLPLPQIAPHLVSHFYQNRQGLHTLSTVDKDIQTNVENLLERWNNEFLQSDIRNIAAIVIDVETKQVLAYCGNVNFEGTRSGNQVDIIRSPRSTGSILKPLLYYAALQEGEILPNMLLGDIPLNVNGFTPQNFNLQFDGAVPASQVIARSLNVPSVLLLRKYGVPKFHDFLQRAGITTLKQSSSYYGLSLILGGAEATLWDIASVYTDMARSLKGLPNYGTSSLLLDETPQKRTSIFQAEGVWQTFESIKELNRPEEIDWRNIPSMQTIAWKTGTSFGFRDAWAVGVTPRYVVGVWVGNASGEGKPGLVGARTAGPVMFDIFNILPASKWFQTPEDGFVEAEVCRLSGHLKGRFCDEFDTVLICQNGLKTKPCPYHIQVNITEDERFRVFEHCIEEEIIVRKGWFVLPPAWEWYYRQQHPEYKVLPPFKAGCSGDEQLPMQFIYPQVNARIKLTKQMDGSLGEVTFELAHSRNHATVFWHLDEEYITSTQDFHKISIRPSVGKHSLTVTDNEGYTLSISIWVE